MDDEREEAKLEYERRQMKARTRKFQHEKSSLRGEEGKVEFENENMRR